MRRLTPNKDAVVQYCKGQWWCCRVVSAATGRGSLRRPVHPTPYLLIAFHNCGELCRQPSVAVCFCFCLMWLTVEPCCRRAGTPFFNTIMPLSIAAAAVAAAAAQWCVVFTLSTCPCAVCGTSATIRKCTDCNLCCCWAFWLVTGSFENLCLLSQVPVQVFMFDVCLEGWEEQTHVNLVPHPNEPALLSQKTRCIISTGSR